MRKKIVTICLSALVALTTIPAVPAMAAGSISDVLDWAVATAKDDKHGYSQSNRWGVNYDCSSFALSAYMSAGFDVNGASCSSDMKSHMTKSGVGFSWISRSTLELDDGTDNLKAGDIMWRSGHVEVYLGNNQLVGAHRDRDGKSGDSSGTEISVTKYNDQGWSGVIRYTGTSKKAVATTTPTVTQTAATAKYPTGTYMVNVEELNVRPQASKGGDAIGIAKEGAVYKVTEVVDKWGKISYGGKTGWISLDYCKKVTAATTASVTSTSSAKDSKKYNYAKGTYKVAVESLYVRAKASKSGKELGVVKEGTTCQVTAVDGKWGRVTYKKKTGWISLKMCKKVTAVSTKSISVKATAIKSGKSKKKAIVLKWTKVSDASGYEVYYSTSQSSGYQKAAVSDNTAKLKVKGLKKKTNYYFKVRTVKKVDGTNYYSAYSAVKSYKTI